MQKSQGDDSDVLETRPTGPSTKLLGGKDVLYTGKGNYVRDNAEKYPTKDGLVGGFAGGERGVDAYVSDGEVSFDENAPPQVRQATMPNHVAWLAMHDAELHACGS